MRSAKKIEGAKTSNVLPFVTGIIFLVVVTVFALFVKTSNAWLYLIFRATLALAVAGIAAILPGFLTYKIAGTAHAGGALAIFLLVFTTNPRSVVAPARFVEAKPSVDCSEQNHGACVISVVVAYRGLGSEAIGALEYRVTAYKDLGITLGPAYEPELLGDFDLSHLKRPTDPGRWIPVHLQKAKSVSAGESSAVTYRATAAHLAGHFAFWALEARLKTSSENVDLGRLELMLPYWNEELYSRTIERPAT